MPTPHVMLSDESATSRQCLNARLRGLVLKVLFVAHGSLNWFLPIPKDMDWSAEGAPQVLGVRRLSVPCGNIVDQ